MFPISHNKSGSLGILACPAGQMRQERHVVLVTLYERTCARTIQGMRALIRVTAWERVSLWRRILGALIRVGILIAFLTVLVNLLGPPVGIFVTTRMEARKAPFVNIAPRILSDYSVSNSPGRTLSYFNGQVRRGALRAFGKAICGLRRTRVLCKFN